MLVIVVSIFSICWLPWQTYMIAALIWPSVNDYRYINIIFFICHWLAMSNSCYNPFIYGVYSEKYRREFSLRIPCLRPLLGHPSEDGTGVVTARTTDGKGGTVVGGARSTLCTPDTRRATRHSISALSSTSYNNKHCNGTAVAASASLTQGKQFLRTDLISPVSTPMAELKASKFLEPKSPLWSNRGSLSGYKRDDVRNELELTPLTSVDIHQNKE